MELRVDEVSQLRNSKISKLPNNLVSEFSHSQWSGKTDGTPWMQRALISMYRLLPLWVLYGCMSLVVPFYMIFNRQGYCSTYRFFRQRLGYGKVRSFLHVYANHFRFGQVILDRFAVYAGKRFHFEVEGREHFDRLAALPGGFIMLSSHVGCYEMAGYTLSSEVKRFNVLVYAGESATIMQQRSALLGRHNMRMVPVSSDMSHLFALHGALSAGEIVSMPADRLFGSSKSVRCTFMGATAPFPVGAYRLSRADDAPMLAVFVMKEGYRRYHLYVRPIATAQDYADALSDMVRRYPNQWFNYYDFFCEC